MRATLSASSAPRNSASVSGHLVNAVLIAAGLGPLALTIFFFRRGVGSSTWLLSAAGVALLIAIVVVVWVRRAEQAIKLNLATLVVASGLSIYLAELGLSLLYKPPTPEVAARKQGASFDTRTLLEVVSDLRADGIDAVPRFLPFSQILSNGLRLDEAPFYPLSGVSNRPTVLCNELGEYLIYDSDGHGFRNSIVPWPATPEVVLIGDSFAHGACVGSGDDIAAQLRHRGREVVTFGMGGSGPLLELAILREYATTLTPRWVFWLYYEANDLVNLNAEMQSPILRSYFEDADFNQGLIHRQGEIDRVLREHLDAQLAEAEARWQAGAPKPAFHASVEDPKLAAWSSVVEFLKLTALRTRMSRLPFLKVQLVGTQAPPDSRFSDILQQARDGVAAWGGELIFVYLGDFSRYANLGTLDAYYHREQVLARVRALKIPIVDLHPVFSNHPDPRSLFPFRAWGHYNRLGYGLVAEEIDRYLRQLPGGKS